MQYVLQYIWDLKKYICRNHITHIAMPRICCGMDKLDWKQVKQILVYIFGDVKETLTITVYNK